MKVYWGSTPLTEQKMREGSDPAIASTGADWTNPGLVNQNTISGNQGFRELS